MAVFRCEVKTINRAAGRSAVAAAAYRAAERLRDERANEGAGKEHDYRRRAPGVAYREVMAGKDTPEWARQRGRLWNEAERAENRRNSVTAREILVSLPHELNAVQRIELVRGFATGLVKRYGVAVDVAIHQPDRKGDQRNHHAHLMMTTRRMNAQGFTEKTRELDDMKKRGPEEIEAIRAMWEQEQNLALERAGRAERVSRLSNKAQGIDREPQPKLGEAATALMRRGEPSRLADRWKRVADSNAMRENAARVRKMREEEQAKQSPMRQNMTRQAERKRSPEVEGRKQAEIQKALDAAKRQQKAHDQALGNIADAMNRDTSEAQQGQRDARQHEKDEARKLDEERAKQGTLAATRAWEKQKQDELRQKREAQEKKAENINDPGLVRKPPGLD